MNSVICFKKLKELFSFRNLFPLSHNNLQIGNGWERSLAPGKSSRTLKKIEKQKETMTYTKR